MRFEKVTLAALFATCQVLIFGPQGLVCQAQEPFLGKWGYVVLGKGGKGSWFGYKTEAGTMVFNQDGSLNNTYKESADRCPGPEYCLESVSEELHYTVDEGGVIVIEDAIKCFLADSQDLMLCDGTMGMEKGGEKFFICAVKLDETNPYNDSDLAGDYFMGNYEKDLYGESRGRNRLASAITSMDGSGRISSVIGYENGDGGLHPLSLADIPIQLDSDGSFRVDDFATGYLDLGRKVAIISNPSAFYPATGDDFAAHVVLKKQDRQYATSDLSGRWAFVGFGDWAGTFRAETGLIFCESSGQCVFSTKTVNLNGSARYVKAERSLSVDLDGSGSINGFHINDEKPHVSGALGNGGNTMILLMNERSDTTNDRLLGLAVRYSQGGVPGFADLALTDFSFPSTVFSGEKVLVTYKVENQGEDASRKRARISWRLQSQDGSWEFPLGTQGIPKLEPGEVLEGSKKLWIKGAVPPGTYNLVLNLDSTNVLMESREDNNQGSLQVTIQQPPGK
jgi:hypothetical protein